MRGPGIIVALALAAAACGSPSVDAPATAEPAPRVARPCPGDAAQPEEPRGTVTVAYPDEPAALHPAFHQDAAAIDLAALWGLPLYAYDDHGQLSPGLVRQATVAEDAAGDVQVRLSLCPGSWSDGEAVGPRDVVATVEALRSSPSPWLVEDIVDVAADGEDVLVTFEGAPADWQHALADLGPVLPAGPLAELGLEAWRDGVPVSGGRFHLDEVEPGHVRRFVANPTSPLGQPMVAEVDVLVVPRFELALGLVDEGRADLALGHLALEGEPRIDGVESVVGAVAPGNTVLTWRWNDADARSEEVRQRVVDGLDLRRFAEGLLGDEGGLARSFTPGVEGPPVPAPARLDDLGEVVVSGPRWHDLPSLVVRGARDALERRGMTVRTASDEADVLARTPLGDATVTIRRLGPRPWLQAADVWDRAVEVPLVRVGVAHAWSEDRIAGIRPSGWPGVAFVTAGEWTTLP